MIDRWLRPIEQIVLAAIESKTRVLGLTSPDAGSGVSLLSSVIAESFTRSGHRTLLVDLTQAAQEAGSNRDWAPGQACVSQIIEPQPAGFDLLMAHPTGTTKFLFNNARHLRKTFVEELGQYAAIVVDLPAILHSRSDFINAAAAASACDAVLMVCITGKITRARLGMALEPLKLAGVNLLGMVLNDVQHPTLGVEIAREARRLFWIVPTFARWIERMALKSSLLN
jgi:Mrp family chromosome partitioning ATPase